jgi:hypothetical protein
MGVVFVIESCSDLRTTIIISHLVTVLVYKISQSSLHVIGLIVHIKRSIMVIGSMRRLANR